MSNNINYTSITKTCVKETKLFKAFCRVYRSSFVHSGQHPPSQRQPGSSSPQLLTFLVFCTQQRLATGGGAVWRQAPREEETIHVDIRGKGKWKANAIVSKQHMVKNVRHKLQASCCGRTGFRGKAAVDTLICMHQAR